MAQQVGRAEAGDTSRARALFQLWCWLCVLCLFWVVDASRAPRMHVGGESKRDIARSTVVKFAYEAYPTWLRAHPSETCPCRLEDLLEWMNNRNLEDPWGHDFQWSCGPGGQVPTEWFTVWSLGEDGEDGTADDVKSWGP